MATLNELKQMLLEGREFSGPLAGYRAYPRSVQVADGTLLCIVRSAAQKRLLAAGEGVDRFTGDTAALAGVEVRLCPLTPANAQAMMALFPFTAPTSHRDAPFTMGLGDRLGLASAGHIRTVLGRGVFPVLAQQSMRELKLTGRNYEEVLAAAAFAVLQEGWQGGYGADGDHLKTADEIRYALGCGFTMITLDCSDQIDKTVQAMDAAQIADAYGALPAGLRSGYEAKYAGKSFDLGQTAVTLTAEALQSIVLTYHRAIDYTVELYQSVIETNPRPVDFEMSIDETLCATSPEAHYVVARELIDRGVLVTSLAPRFIGEFQKGIDYMGNLSDFERDFIVHQKIAAHFGYKLSIHSGSDKFSVFGIIGRHTGLKVHVKTAGTNWLEALRVIAVEDPALFRELLAFAMERVGEARAYYHISGEVSRVVPPQTVPDDRLTEYLDYPDPRQILHITYGLILQEKNADGKPRFKTRIEALLHRAEDRYAQALERHIGRHIDTLSGKA